MFRRKQLLAVIARCRDEPFVEEFAAHYLHEGADRVFLIDDPLDMPVPDSLRAHPQVEVLPASCWQPGRGEQVADVAALYQAQRRRFEWFAVVDCDEYMTTRRYPQRTIADELESSFSAADVVLVPWVMMASGAREQDPSNLLEELVYRWDHDRRHPNPSGWRKGRCRYDEIEVKSLFRSRRAAGVATVHLPAPAPGRRPRVVSGVDGAERSLSPYHAGLRNQDIEDALLICHHYRIPSRESALRKIRSSGKLTAGGGYRDLDAILSTDHAEVRDETLMHKARARRNDD